MSDFSEFSEAVNTAYNRHPEGRSSLIDEAMNLMYRHYKPQRAWQNVKGDDSQTDARPDNTNDVAQAGDRQAEGGHDGDARFDGLRSAIQRARAGGRPLSVLHYGDSHVAGKIEPGAIRDLFNESTPVSYFAKAKGGKTAAYPLEHKQEWLDQTIAQTKPDLILVAFGSNEAAGNLDAKTYAKQYDQLVTEIQRRSPNATIVLVGPTDGDSIIGANKGHTLPNLTGVIAIQKQVAAAHGLDYYDSRAAMGGPGSIEIWHQQGLTSPDKLHLSAAGYKKYAGMIYDHIVDSMNS